MLWIAWMKKKLEVCKYYNFYHRKEELIGTNLNIQVC